MPTPARHYMIGGGIAALAAAVYLIRDAGISGSQIHIIDDQPAPGGALDGSGTDAAGFLTRGGRMFERYFLNTFDLLSRIPSADDANVSAYQDILDFNTMVQAGSNCRLIAGGRRAFAHQLIDAGLQPIGHRGRRLIADRVRGVRDEAVAERLIDHRDAFRFVHQSVVQQIENADQQNAAGDSKQETKRSVDRAEDRILNGGGQNWRKDRQDQKRRRKDNREACEHGEGAR